MHFRPVIGTYAEKFKPYTFTFGGGDLTGNERVRINIHFFFFFYSRGYASIRGSYFFFLLIPTSELSWSICTIRLYTRKKNITIIIILNKPTGFTDYKSTTKKKKLFPSISVSNEPNVETRSRPTEKPNTLVIRF